MEPSAATSIGAPAEAPTAAPATAARSGRSRTPAAPNTTPTAPKPAPAPKATSKRKGKGKAPSPKPAPAISRADALDILGSALAYCQAAGIGAAYHQRADGLVLWLADVELGELLDSPPAPVAQ